MQVSSYQEFSSLSSQGNLIPVIATLDAGTETPVSAFLKMTHPPYRFLLESMEGGERWGRYSFLGSEPAFVFRSKGRHIEIVEGKKNKKFIADPLIAVRGLLARYKAVCHPEVPRFAGGLVGYFGYDVVRFMERLPDMGKPGLPFFDIELMLQDSVIVFDNLNHQLKIVVMQSTNVDGGLKRAYDCAIKRIDSIASRLKNPLPKEKKTPKGTLRIKSNTSEKLYHAMVKKAKAYIKAGDIFQVVPSQRWEMSFKGDPFRVYQKLRQVNPSPYLYYLQLDDNALAGSSPEVMVRLEGSKVTVRPIAGTRRRGRDEADEKRMQKEMQSDPKEVAEHIMLVDLGRNDIGRVAELGSVKVTKLLAVEKYSHVMHLVSNVEGQVKKGFDAMDVLKATFPAGTLTGAPKIRAMEIIEELEVARRGPYGGAVGYLDFYGNMDTAITIRTVAFTRDKAYFQSGGGVVLDSRPELEYLESQNKAKVMREVLKQCS